MTEKFLSLWQQTGLYGFFGDMNTTIAGFLPLGIGQLIMIIICLILLYLGIAKKFEPLLLVPIAFGMLLVNIFPDIMVSIEKSENGVGGLLYYFYLMDEWAILPSLSGGSNSGLMGVSMTSCKISLAGA